MEVSEATTVFRRLEREVWLLTASVGDERGGLIATSVSQASLASSAPRVLVGLARSHHTWGLVEQRGAFVLHLLDEGRLDLVWRFGLHSGHETRKFDGLAFQPGRSGAPRLVELPCWLDCRVETRMEAGDRTFYLAEVLEAHAGPEPRILTMRRLLELAPDRERGRLKEQVAREMVAEAEAIERWRHERRSSRN